MDPHAPVAAGELDPVAVHRHDDRADPLGPLAAGPPAPDQDPRGHVAERRVVLVAVEPPAARPVGHQRAAHVLDGRAGVGLGDADAHDGLAVGHLRQPPVLQGVAAEVLDPPGRPVEGQLAADGRGHVVAGDLLQHDGRLDVTESQPTPLLADGHPEQVGGGQGGQRLLGQLAGQVGVPGRRVPPPGSPTSRARARSAAGPRSRRTDRCLGTWPRRTGFLRAAVGRLLRRARPLAGPEACHSIPAPAAPDLPDPGERRPGPRSRGVACCWRTGWPS